MRSRAEGTVELAAEVRGRQSRRAGKRAHVELIAVASVNEVSRAQEVPRGMDVGHGPEYLRHELVRDEAQCQLTALPDDDDVHGRSDQVLRHQALEISNPAHRGSAEGDDQILGTKTRLRSRSLSPDVDHLDAAPLIQARRDTRR